MSIGGRSRIAESSNGDVPASRQAIRAVILDLDGTLYHQGPVRRAMARRLAWYVATQPRAGVRAFRFIRAYRESQEMLRTSAVEGGAREQLEHACRRTGDHPDWAAGVVRQWMDVAPLTVIARHVRRDLAAFLDAAERRGIALGLFSDYPADAKLEALGVRSRFGVVRCAQEAEVGVFKPNPRGLLATARSLGVDPASTLHVGDRALVDGAAAEAAGMQSAIIGGASERADAPAASLHVRSFTELLSQLGW